MERCLSFLPYLIFSYSLINNCTMKTFSSCQNMAKTISWPKICISRGSKLYFKEVKFAPLDLSSIVRVAQTFNLFSAYAVANISCKTSNIQIRNNLDCGSLCFLCFTSCGKPHYLEHCNVDAANCKLRID